MNYLVLDLEMCKIAGGRKQAMLRNEIIQIGAVLLNENYEKIGSFNSFVRPVAGMVDHFIENLTGISQNQVKKAPLLKDVVTALLDWCGEEECAFVSWSKTDLHQLQRECNWKEIEDVRLEEKYETWIDAQELFSERIGQKRAFNLEYAMIVSDVDAGGRCHDGLADAENTAVLFRKLRTEEEYCWQKDYVESRKEESEGLSFSMGELLANLKIG